MISGIGAARPGRHRAARPRHGPGRPTRSDRELAANRSRVLTDLDGDQPVYGVNTGMGAQAGSA